MQRLGTDKYYVIGQLLVALWKVKPMMLNDGSSCFVVGSGDELYSHLLPAFINPIDLDDFEAVPSRIVATINVWWKNGKPILFIMAS